MKKKNSKEEKRTEKKNKKLLTVNRGNGLIPNEFSIQNFLFPIVEWFSRLKCNCTFTAIIAYPVQQVYPLWMGCVKKKR